MPILDPQYISSWYTMKANTDGIGDGDVFYLLESWNEDEQQSIQKKELLQGDIGLHVASVEGMKWITQVKSPALILETIENGSSDTVYTVLDLLVTSFNTIRSYAKLSQVAYLLKTAVIEIDEKGVSCSLTYWSDTPGAFTPFFSPVGGPGDFIGRTAMNYDVIFSSDELQRQGLNEVFVKSGRIEIDVSVSENYFIGQGLAGETLPGQKPFYGVTGYSVKGSITAVVNPQDFSQLEIVEQGFGQFVRGANSSFLQIGIPGSGGTALDFGSVRLHGNMKRSLQPNSVATLDLNFISFARWTPDAEA